MYGPFAPCLHADEPLTFSLRYPALYSVLVAPLSISRWLGYAMQNESPPRQLSFAVSIVSITLFGLSGLVNVALFVVTRPKLLLFDRTPKDTLTVRTFSFAAPRRPAGRSGSESLGSISLSREFHADIPDSSKPGQLSFARSPASSELDGSDLPMRPLKSPRPLDEGSDDSASSDSDECDITLVPHAV